MAKFKKTGRTATPVSTAIKVAQRIAQLLEQESIEADEPFVIDQQMVTIMTFHCYGWFLVAADNDWTLFGEAPRAGQGQPVIRSLNENWLEITQEYKTMRFPEQDTDIDLFITKIFHLYTPMTVDELLEQFCSTEPYRYAQWMREEYNSAEPVIVRRNIYTHYAQVMSRSRVN